MLYKSSDEQILLDTLAERLRTARLQRNESQALFAERIGISRITYAKMEKGNPAIPIGYWLQASAILNRLEDWRHILEQEDLFALYEFRQKQKKRARKRASKEST